jgi:threonine dehydrogenase-like Zn-dependent dehydrogenase
MLNQISNQPVRLSYKLNRVPSSRLMVCRAGPMHVDVAISGAGPAGLAAAAALTRAEPNLKVATTVHNSFRSLQEAAARTAGRQQGCVGEQ